MSSKLGQSLALSRGRRFIGDLLDAGINVPSVSINKMINVQDIAAARQAASPKPSWCAIFTKAYAIACQRHPVMRRVYLAFPWARLFEYTTATADVAIEVNLAGESVVAFAPLKQPATTPLLEIDRTLRECKEDPLEHLPRWQRALKLTRYPRFFRRWVWWFLLNTTGRKRARFFGTFGVSSIAGFGIDSLSPISPSTTVLHYGPIDADGIMPLRVTLDHRVMDGAAAALAVCDVERILNSEIIEELKSLAHDGVRPKAA